MTHITPPEYQEREQSEIERRGDASVEAVMQERAPKFCDKCGERATFWVCQKPLVYLCDGCSTGVVVKLWQIRPIHIGTIKTC